MDYGSNLQRILAAVNKMLGMGMIALIAYFGEQEKATFIHDIWTAAKTASPFVAMFSLLMFFDERKERREAQSQCQKRTVEFIQSTNMASTALSKMADAATPKE